MNKNNNPLYKALQDHTRKRISLEELNRICQDHEQLAQQYHVMRSMLSIQG